MLACLSCFSRSSRPRGSLAILRKGKTSFFRLPSETHSRKGLPFLNALGEEKSADMWRLAFERWDGWDYGRHEEDKHLTAPAACSFDFPVAIYYALLPLEETEAEKKRLQEGIATVEQKWFAEFSDLVTYRNRLSSRLRLVQHGLAIRNPPPGGATPLPPPVEPDSEFAEFRYRFFDVSSLQRRGR